MSCPKIPIQLSRRINEIRTSLLDGTRIEVTIERLTTPRNIIDEKDSSRTHTYKRDTTLVTIKRLLRPVQEESESSLATSAQSQVKNHENIDKTCDAGTGCDASHNHSDKVESQNKGENQAQKDWENSDKNEEKKVSPEESDENRVKRRIYTLQKRGKRL
jgi:hypothetical protein